jgi:hypothetical protein
VLRLFPGPCTRGTDSLVETALRNLGWDGVVLNAPPIAPASLDIGRLDADLDGAGTDEVVLYGGGLLVETYTHPGSGTGIRVDALYATILQCDSQQCATIWRQQVGLANRACGGHPAEELDARYPFCYTGSGGPFERADGPAKGCVG